MRRKRARKLLQHKRMRMQSKLWRRKLMCKRPDIFCLGLGFVVCFFFKDITVSVNFIAHLLSSRSTKLT